MRLPRPSRILESPPKHLSFVPTIATPGTRQKFEIFFDTDSCPDLVSWYLATENSVTRDRTFSFATLGIRVRCQASIDSQGSPRFVFPIRPEFSSLSYRIQRDWTGYGQHEKSRK